MSEDDLFIFLAIYVTSSPVACRYIGLIITFPVSKDLKVKCYFKEYWNLVNPSVKQPRFGGFVVVGFGLR